MYIKTKFEHCEPDGHHDLFLYGNNEDYLLFLQQFFLDACSHKGCRIVFYGPEETCRILKEILSFWDLSEKRFAVTVCIYSIESFFDPDECFNRKKFLISLRKLIEADGPPCIYSCVDMNLPLISIKNEKAIFCFIAALNRAYADSAVTGFCSLSCLNSGKEHERRNFIRQFRKVFFPEKAYRNADICRCWQNQIGGVYRGISELLAGSRLCSEKLLSGMLRSQAGEETVFPENQYDQLVDHFLEEVLWITDERGCITYVSPAIEPISGRHNGIYIGKHIFDAVSPENIQITQEMYRTGIRHSRKKSAGPVTRKGTFIVGEGRRITLKVSILPIKIDLELIGFVGSIMCEGRPGLNTRLESGFPDELNERDLQILEYLLEGFSSREIGDRMAMAEITIKKNLTRIYRICNVMNRTDLLTKLYKR